MKTFKGLFKYFRHFLWNPHLPPRAEKSGLMLLEQKFLNKNVPEISLITTNFKMKENIVKSCILCFSLSYFQLFSYTFKDSFLKHKVFYSLKLNVPGGKREIGFF